jgi:hypothetical protein
MATRSRVFAVPGFSVLVQVGTGPMQGYSSLDVELRRVLNLAQSVPCLLGEEGRKNGLLPHEVKFYRRSQQVL